MSPLRQLQNKAAEFDIFELQNAVSSRLGLAWNVQQVVFRDRADLFTW